MPVAASQMYFINSPALVWHLLQVLASLACVITMPRRNDISKQLQQLGEH